MANETNDLAGALTNLANAVGTVFQQSIEIWSTVLKSSLQAVEPLGKAAGDLVGSATSSLGQAVQNVSSTLAQKK